MSDPTGPNRPQNPEPDFPPIETIPDDQRQPPRQQRASIPPKADPIRLRDDVPVGVIVVGLLVVAITAIVGLKVAVPKAIHWAGHHDWHHFTQWAATIHQPVHDYLAAHTAGLPITAVTAYTVWQGIGIGSLAVAWLTGAVGARLTWTAYGAATVWMVWAASPATGRTVAAGLAVLAWTAISTLALRGLSLRPVILTR